MKRQAEGSVSTEEVETTETNGNKRMKLLKNEAASKEDFPAEGTEEMSAVETSLNENSQSYNHNEYIPSISKNNSSNELSDDLTGSENTAHNSSQNINENGDINHMANNNYNGSHEEAAEESASAIENSALNSEENNFIEENEPAPPVLNSCYDIHNSESTDSFQSEGFEAQNCTQETGNNVLEKQISQQEQNNDLVKEHPPVESDVKKRCSIDVDNLSLSHLKVTELEGHNDLVFSVAADRDYVLSASADTTVKVWSMENKNAISTFSGHSANVTAVLLLNANQSKALKKKASLTKVSRIAITGSLDCNLKLWSVLEGKELASVYTFNGITCLGYLESECIIVVGTEGGKLELWDMISSKAVTSEHAHEDAVTDIQVKDNYIYSVSVDGTVKVWAYEDQDIYPLYTRKRKEFSPHKIGFRPAHWKTVAVSDDIIYLGDDTKNIKVLDWRAGRLRLFKNQSEEQAICESLVAEKNMLFTACYDSSSDTGGINVWKLPELTYVCTLADAVPYIKSLAVVHQDNKLQIVCGGHKLCIWEFDFSSPPSTETESYIRELESLGHEIDEKAVEIKKAENKESSSNSPNQNSPTNRWCSVM